MNIRGLWLLMAFLSLSVFAQQGDEPPVVLLPSGASENPQALLQSAKQAVSVGAAVAQENKPSTPTEQVPLWSGYKAAESLATNGNPELALKQLEARLVSAPDDAKAAYLKGLILMQLGRADDAERWFKMMQSNFPNLPQPYNALAIIYMGKGDLLSAMNVLQALLAQHPNHRNAQINLANIYLKLAQENYQKALKAKPDDDMIAQKLKALNAISK